MSVNRMLLYKGSDFQINNSLIIHHPTVGEIIDSGEQDYWFTVNNICATASDIKHILFDKFKKFYNEVDDFEVFRILTPRLPLECSKILFPNIDFSSFVQGLSQDTNDYVLVNRNTKMVIDRLHYNLIVEFIRAMNSIKRNYDIPGNASTRQFLIDESREKSKSPPKEFKSTLIPRIEFMRDTGIPDYSFDRVWNLPVYVLSRDFERNLSNTHKKMQSQAFLTNVYNNPENLKKFDKKNVYLFDEPE